MTTPCESSSACPGTHGGGCRRRQLHHLWGSGRAQGSLTLLQSPTHSSCPCGNGSRGRSHGTLPVWALYLVYSQPHTVTTRGERKYLGLRGSCQSFLLSCSSAACSQDFAFSLLHRHLLTLPSSLSRVVQLVLVLRNWASKSLHEEQQRPDPFLERFQGPELQTVAAGAANDVEDEETVEENKK